MQKKRADGGKLNKIWGEIKTRWDGKTSKRIKMKTMIVVRM